jgi:hypothetical protein
MHSRRAPLSEFRLVVTLPPSGFFGGLDRRRADDQVMALQALGATVYAFETRAIYAKDYAEVDRQIAEIKEFKPDAVIGAQHAGYAIQGGMIQDPDGALIQNLFLDVLGLPTVFYWDHVLTQAARYLIAAWPRSPAESVSGVISKLKALMAHPLAVHFLPDSGHITELNRLGLASFAYDPFFVTAVSQVFVQHGEEAHGAPTHLEAVSFFGNLYLAATNNIPYGPRVRMRFYHS